MRDFLIALGFIGAAIVLAAYFATQRGRLTADDWRFPAMNLAGAALLAVSCAAQWNASSFVIDVAWIAISVGGLAKGFSTRQRKERP